MEQELENLLRIRYIKLHFAVEMAEDTKLPADKVSALRGGMGEMLLRAHCVRDRDCERCDFEPDCVVRRTMYSRYDIAPQFVTTGDSIGYILECENYDEIFSAGDILKFNMILFGKAIAYFNIFMQAFFSLGNEGIGKNHSRFRIASVANTQNQPLLARGAVYMKNYSILNISGYVGYRVKRIRENGCCGRFVFHTPATIKYQGAFLDEYDMEAIWNAVLRRIYMLECFEGIAENVYDMHGLKECALPRIAEQQAKRAGIRRYSSTQDRKMTLTGIKGFAQPESLPDRLLPFLIAGELTHIGKNISFGFGRYTIV